MSEKYVLVLAPSRRRKKGFLEKFCSQFKCLQDWDWKIIPHRWSKISQAKDWISGLVAPEWGNIINRVGNNSLENICVCVCGWVCGKSLQSCPTLCGPMDCSLSLGFSRQELWSGRPWPSPGGLPDPGTEPASLTPPALVGLFSTTSTVWGALHPYTVGIATHSSALTWRIPGTEEPGGLPSMGSQSGTWLND